MFWNALTIYRLRVKASVIEYSVKSSLITNAGFLWGISITGAVSGFIFWSLSARFYTTADLGFASSVISISQLLGTIASLGIGNGLIRLLADSKYKENLINAAFVINLTATIITGLVYVIGINYWSPALQVLNSSYIFFGFILFLIVTNQNLLIQTIFLAFRKSRIAFWMIILLNASRLVLLIPFQNTGSFGIVASLALGIIISNVVGLYLFVQNILPSFKFNFRITRAIITELLPYSFGNYIADLFYRIPSLLTPVIVIEILNPESSAHAYIAWMLGSVVLAPGIAIAQSSFAEGSYKPENNIKNTKKAILFALLITVPLAVIFGVSAPLLLHLFGKSYSNEGFILLRWLCISTPFATINMLIFTYLRVNNRLKILIFLNMLAASLAIFIPILFMKNLGIEVTGIGWFISQSIITFLVITFLVVRKTRNSL